MTSFVFINILVITVNVRIMLLYLPNWWEEFRTSVTQLKLGFFKFICSSQYFGNCNHNSLGWQCILFVGLVLGFPCIIFAGLGSGSARLFPFLGLILYYTLVGVRGWLARDVYGLSIDSSHNLILKVKGTTKRAKNNIDNLGQIYGWASDILVGVSDRKGSLVESSGYPLARSSSVLLSLHR